MATNFAKGSQAYQSAQPFPHIAIENFIENDLVKKLTAEFPKRDQNGHWLDFNGADSRGKIVQANKYHISDEDRMGPTLQRLLYELKSEKFLRILEKLTGIENLIPDAQNHGGGIHMSCRGALLKVHADFNRHPNWHLDRRLNLLLYLNSSWKEEWGGHLELWNQDMSKCTERILPIAGRCVIFSTSSTSYHGHPDPLTCPETESRKSVALYYYTNRKPDQDVPTHSTLWKDRPSGN